MGKKWSEMTPEQRERKNATNRKWNKNMTPEQRERKKERERERFRNMTPEQIARKNRLNREWLARQSPEWHAQNRIKNLLRYDSPNRPDSYTPQWVGREIRVRTILAGGNPESSVDIAGKAVELANENPDLSRGHLCGDYLIKYAGDLAKYWKHMSPKSKDSIYKEVEMRQVNLSQFESEPPQA